MSQKILMIEDARFARKVLMNALESGNYTNVIEAVNAKEGEELFKQENPDLVLLDITLPDNDDLSLLKRLLEIDPKANIVMCSAMGQEIIIKNALQIGAKDFIIKPFETKNLLEIVNKYILK